MEHFLGTITQHAMNYAIRSGIAVTFSFALGQTSKLIATVDDAKDRKELAELKRQLDSKISIISTAIDIVDLFSARGHTTLENAVSMANGLRWAIQSLGVRVERSISEDEVSRRRNGQTISRTAHKAQIREIIKEIRALLIRIDTETPYLSMAIATSGVGIATTLPSTVSPSRLLQASQFINTGDNEYVLSGGTPTRIGPLFTVTLYMLFTGHTSRMSDEEGNSRGATWKEVTHKTRVQLVRTSKDVVARPKRKKEHPSDRFQSSITAEDREIPLMPDENFGHNYCYHLEVIEDLDDDRIHSLEDGEPQPGPYGGVEHAGIRLRIPIYQISRIFYADTNKVLNIGSEDEPNRPVLLIRRDLDARSSREMMQGQDVEGEWDNFDECRQRRTSSEDSESEDDPNEQIRRESSIDVPEEDVRKVLDINDNTWGLPANLDPEWMAFEIYREAPDTDSETDHEEAEGLIHIPHGSSSAGGSVHEDNLAEGIANLDLKKNSLSPPTIAGQQSIVTSATSSPTTQNLNPGFPAFPTIQSSLSLLEMLLRLSSCQQFNQKSNLAINDQMLTFFLDENSSAGAAGPKRERQRARQVARERLGFDPWSESPIKRRSVPFEEDEVTESREMSQEEQAPSSDLDYYHEYPSSRVHSPALQGASGWLRRDRGSSSARSSPGMVTSSPTSPYQPQKKKVTGGGPLDRVRRERSGDSGKQSPLARGRGMSADTDSSLGTSPGSPTLLGATDKI